MNITLIRMSGAGKSYIGEKVAKELGLEFLDVDRTLLEPARNMPLQRILDELGDEKFMQWEEGVMVEATAGRDGLLVSTPGSVIFEQGAMEHFRNISRVIYLQVPFCDIERRAVGERGIVGMGSKSLRELYDERAPLYEKYAHHTVDVGVLELRQAVETLVDIARTRGS